MSARAKATPAKEYPEPVYLVKHSPPKPGPKSRIDRDSIKHEIVSTALDERQLAAFEIMRKAAAPRLLRPTRSAFLRHIIAQYIDTYRRRDLPGTVPVLQPPVAREF